MIMRRKRLINNSTKAPGRRDGFTMLEIVVAMSIFVFALLSATQIFQKIMEGQRNTITSQNIQENFRFALELMSKEMRNAQYPIGDCVNNGPGDDSNIYSALRENGVTPVGSTNKGVGLGYKLIFKNKYDECVMYQWIGDMTAKKGQIWVTRIYGGNTRFYPITPQNIFITKFRVNVEDRCLDANTRYQPSATVIIQAEDPSDKYYNKNRLNIQTTITSRSYEERPDCTY